MTQSNGRMARKQAMKLKLDANGNVVVQDGKPVYTNDAGSDVAFDVVGTTATIQRLNGEAKGHRERAEAAEGSLKAFTGIDAEAAKSALDVVSKLDQKKLIDAGKVDEVRSEVNKAWETKMAEEQGKVQALEQQLHGELIGGSFARSKVIADTLTLPADIVQATFGNAFKIESGKVVAHDKDGKKIFSRSNPGEAAGFEEALSILVDAYPHKDQITKGSGASGSGATGGKAGTPSQRGDIGGDAKARTAAFAARHPELKG